MLERQASLRDVSMKRQEELKKKLVEEKLEEERERRRKRLEQLNKPIIKHDVEWKDYAAVEDARRKQRIEQRKQEMTMSMQSLGGVSSRLYEQASSPHRSSYDLTRSRSSPLIQDHYKPFKATEDPEKVGNQHPHP
jgi:hypothetical protein